jgi:N-acetylmuramoyl-L-alanine amidase
MALKLPAGIAVRPRLALLAAATLMAAGCGHGRQSYRPVYTSPAVVSTPCSNCGNSSAVTPSGPDSSVSSDVPILPGSSTADTPVTSDSARPSAGANPPADPAPKSRLSDEPSFDESPAPASNPVRSTSPPPPPKPLNPAKAPTVEGPAATQAGPRRNLSPGTGTQLGAANPSPVRRAGLTQRLKPYLDEANANDLYYPNKADRPWKYIVLHQSAKATGNYDEIDREHRKILGYDGCGYHFVIGNGSGSDDGQIEVSQRWNSQKQGAHCRNAKSHDADEYGIGIVLVGNFEEQPPTPRQIAAAQALIAYLSQRYQIAPAGVRTHAHLAATPTVCPGKYFPSEAMLMLSKEALGQGPVRTTTWKVAKRDH